METTQTESHRMRWFVYSGGEKLPHTATMRGHWPGWDAECSCGWKSATGGATRGYIKDEVWFHKWQAAN
jgi:hypothetical protein